MFKVGDLVQLAPQTQASMEAFPGWDAAIGLVFKVRNGRKDCIIRWWIDGTEVFASEAWEDLARNV